VAITLACQECFKCTQLHIHTSCS